WVVYTFCTGLFGTGLWMITHECDYQTFSESKLMINGVGWVYSLSTMHLVRNLTLAAPTMSVSSSSKEASFKCCCCRLQP
ncbi:hypothetical protein EDB19DRAFT_1629738, partial [Suillus lakei]